MARVLSRRTLLGSLALGAACAAAGLVGCSDGDGGAVSAEPAATSPLAGKLGGKLVLRTSCSETLVNAAVSAFTEETGVAVRIVSSSDGELLSWYGGDSAEGAGSPLEPAPDVVWGADPSWYAGSEALLEEYISGENAAMREGCRSVGGRITPVTRDVAVIAVGEGAGDGAEVTGYEALLDERVVGSVAMEDPSTSARGLAHLAGIVSGLSGQSADAPWEYARDLLAGGALVSARDVLDAPEREERAVALTSEQRLMQARLLESPAPDSVYPREGSCVTCECTAIVAGCANLRQARAWIDFVTGKACQERLAAEAFARPSRSDVAEPDGLPDVEDPTVPDRAGLLASWARVLDGTWEPSEVAPEEAASAR